MQDRLSLNCLLGAPLLQQSVLKFKLALIFSEHCYHMSWELAIQRKWVSFHSVKNPRTALILAQYLLQHLKFQCQMERQGLSFLHLEPRFEFIVRSNQSRIQLPARNHIMPTQCMVRLVW